MDTIGITVEIRYFTCKKVIFLTSADILVEPGQNPHPGKPGRIVTLTFRGPGV